MSTTKTKGFISRSLLADIADAIRAKDPGAAQAMTPAEMAEAIADIDTGYTLDDMCGRLILKDTSVVLQADRIREFAFYSASAGSDESPETFTVQADSCTEVGEYAFSLSFISSFSSAACTDIGDQAFDMCEDLETVSIPAAEVIGTQAFGGCLLLSRADLPAVRVIGDNAFSGCEALEIVNIGSGVESIGKNAFTGTAISSLTAAGEDLTIRGKAFEGSNINTLYVGASVIEAGAFKSVSEVHFTAKPTVLNTLAFDGTTTDVYCNWSEGEVAGAPWGAVNAAIHYI